MDLSTFVNVSLRLLEGFGTTVQIFCLTLLFSLPLGLIFSFASMSRFTPLKLLMRVFVWIIRGSPLMLQLIIVYYGPGLLASAMERAGTLNIIYEFAEYLNSFPPLTATVVAFSINYACYFSEIFRGGIESIPRGQYEAGQVLGMTKIQIFFRVILLQVIKRIIPPMSNEIITLVKDTSLARIITCYEIIYVGESFTKSQGLVWPLFYTGAFYLLFCGILTILFGYIEKKLDYFKA
ncbi:MAG: amino acid ABC transporter permease [Clostridia bacterium]|nr:amino acid ABC transporter permease [Clostridia bacterium]